MPRLTTRDYLTHRTLLLAQWLDHDGGAFASLPLHAQHDLHDSYAPAQLMSDDEALAHRDAMAKAFPSLPQKAGRAFQALQASLNGTPNQLLDGHRERATRHITVGKKQRQIRVEAIARPVPDYDRVANAVVGMLKEHLATFDAADPATRKKLAAEMHKRAQKAKRQDNDA